MNHARSKKTRIKRVATRTQKTLLPLFAVGGGLASLPASALELGDVTVESRLGQPLRASIAYALGPNEQLSNSCVKLGLGAPRSGLPGIGRTTLSLADGTILLTGNAPIREPMVAATINVDCAYTANISREYLMFIDPANPVYDTQPGIADQPQTNADSQTATTATRPDAVRSTTRSRTAQPQVDRSSIASSTRYRVQAGDTLSEIVQRIENRSTRLWPAVNAIFDANPDAFINDDPNMLKAGSWLTIPAHLSAQAPSSTIDTTGNTRAAASADTVAASAVPVEGASAEIPLTNTGSTNSDTTNDLSPVGSTEIGDSTRDNTRDNPLVNDQAISAENTVIPDTELEGPVTNSTSPNVTTAVINTDTNTESTSSSSSWLMWLAGSGLALIIALLLFGRMFRGRPIESETAIAPQRRATDRESGDALDDTGIEVITHSGYTIEDDSPTAENVALDLDADLVMGTGLEEGAEMDMEVAQDFGFAAPTEVDIELPFEPEATTSESDTDTFATNDMDASILEGGEAVDNDEYDLSVVLDATKMPRSEDITQHDLQAVEVEPVDDLGKTDNYTINSEVDLEILEQDYEDELTATQALNAEILRAAEELAAESSQDQADSYEITSEVTAAMPLASVTDLDITAQLEPGADDAKLDDETGIHEAATVEMPVAENDETVDMEVDGGKVDTKAL
ncbi:MAG: type IV pilus assembly protein FimV [Woeseiaceae bacterium]